MVHLSESRCVALTAILVAVSGPAAAATIYGSVSERQLPAANRPMELVCPGQSPIRGATDEHGSYRFTVSAVGSCIVRMGPAEAPVILSVNPAQYNFELRDAGGHRALIQR